MVAAVCSSLPSEWESDQRYATPPIMSVPGCGERALLVIWDEILSLSDSDDGTAIRALGALCLGSRSLAGLCWDEAWVSDEDEAIGGEMVALFMRAEHMREVYEDYLARAEGALAAWEWREIEHEIWAARFAEASMYQDTWSPPSGWSDDD